MIRTFILLEKKSNMQARKGQTVLELDTVWGSALAQNDGDTDSFCAMGGGVSKKAPPWGSVCQSSQEEQGMGTGSISKIFTAF